MTIYKKEIIAHPDFYICQFSRRTNNSYLIFIHGGPGSNCGAIEHLIENNGLFDSLNHNIILYDQRKCGRSTNTPKFITHADNVNDINNICKFLNESKNINLEGLIGHSYGAKVLFDYYEKFKPNLPGIFISTADSILTPRLNNLILDLNYLKKTNPSRYEEILGELDNLDLKKIWDLTEKLAPLFQENNDRHYMYWANLNSYEKVLKIQKEINLPLNTEAFMQVRKDLYSNEKNFGVNIQNLKTPYLWINGFHDYIMNGASTLTSKKSWVTLFPKSSHYPHIEENERFCESVNAFLEDI